MKRGLSAIVMASSLLVWTSSVIGQSPYPDAPTPYGAMPMQYPPQMPMQYPQQMPMQYPPQMPMQYPQQMPMQYPPQMPTRYPQQMSMQYPPQMPMQYPPPYGNPQAMPMPYAPANPAIMRPMPAQWQNAPVSQPRVYDFGPLTAAPAPQDAESAPVHGAPASQGRETLSTLPSEDMLPEEYDSDGPTCYGAGCAPAVRALPARGRGHFITTLGAWLLVPYPGTNAAFNTTSGGTTTSTQFGQEMQYGPRASFGYVFHNCWGVRGNYSYLVGDVNQSISNSTPGATITTPISSPFGITSPSAALTAGLAPDQFNFRQKFEFHVADIELLREARILDTTFLFSAGARYARFEQTYIADRTNPGGVTPATAVALSQENLNTASLFSGWGPTVSFDVSHPILPCGISVYGNARGSYLFGTDRFTQNYNTQSRSTTAGVTTFTDSSQSSVNYDNRAASILEGEVGLQCGVRLGRCYVFGRAGAVYQRWFDVGSPTSSQGNLSFVGGTATVGVTY